MDFSLTDDQESLRTLAADIFGDKATPERVEQIEDTAERFDRDLWRELADAGLLGHRAAGDGRRRRARARRTRSGLRAARPGRRADSAGVDGDGGHGARRPRRCRAAALGRAGRVRGGRAHRASRRSPRPGCGSRTARSRATIAGVPYAHVAAAIVVPVRGELYLLDPAGSGVTVVPAVATTREIHAELILDHAPVQQIGSDAAAWWEARLLVGLAATAAGITDAALRQTAKYTSERLQFDKPLSTFQGVALKAADAYVDAMGIRSAVLQAAWRLDAAEELGTTPARGERVRPHRCLVGRRGGSALRAHHPASARRIGCRHHVSDPPLLPVGQVDRALRRRCVTHACSARRRARHSRRAG